jgi:hypothetical protein
MLPRDERPKSEAQREALAARGRCRSERGVWAHKRRMADAEGVIGELKNRHRLDRARSRGTPLFHVQNLARLYRAQLQAPRRSRPEAANGVAGAPQPAVAELRAAAVEADGADRTTPSPANHALGRPLGASPSTRSYSVCLNRAPDGCQKPFLDGPSRALRALIGSPRSLVERPNATVPSVKDPLASHRITRSRVHGAWWVPGAVKPMRTAPGARAGGRHGDREAARHPRRAARRDLALRQAIELKTCTTPLN